MEIKQAEFVISNTDYRKCPQDGKPEHAFIGRSNVGKSSLINMITGRKSLALTSSRPGKTLTINHFLINKEWYLVDLPGYGYAKRSNSTREDISKIVRSYVVRRLQLTNLFVLVDVRHEPQQNDLNFLEFLGENGIPFAIIYTKCDKLSASKCEQNINNYIQKMLEVWEEMPPYFRSSALSGDGKAELLDYIDSVNREIKG